MDYLIIQDYLILIILKWWCTVYSIGLVVYKVKEYKRKNEKMSSFNTFDLVLLIFFLKAKLPRFLAFGRYKYGLIRLIIVDLSGT